MSCIYVAYCAQPVHTQSSFTHTLSLSHTHKFFSYKYVQKYTQTRKAHRNLQWYLCNIHVHMFKFFLSQANAPSTGNKHQLTHSEPQSPHLNTITHTYTCPHSHVHTIFAYMSQFIPCTHTNRHPNITHTLGSRCRNHTVDNE